MILRKFGKIVRQRINILELVRERLNIENSFVDMLRVFSVQTWLTAHHPIDIMQKLLWHFLESLGQRLAML